MSSPVSPQPDDRVLRHAIPLPPAKDGPLMDEQHTRIAEAFRQFLDRIGISQSEAARKISGVAASTISQYLSGTYRGDLDAVGRRLNRWMEQEGRARDVRVELPYVRTSVAEAIRKVITVTIEQGKMAAIVAPAGSGKTKVVQLTAEDQDGVYIYCDEDLTPSALYHQLALAVKVNTTLVSRGAAALKRAIVDKLKGTNRPIFLDEAHLLPPKVFAGLRSIYDQTGCPIIFVGAYEIIGRVDDRSSGRGQLSRRCYTFNALEHFSSVEGGGPGGSAAGGGLGRPLYTLDEIRQVFAASPLKLTDAAFEMLWAIACLPSHGCLGTAKDIVDMAWRTYARKPQVGLDELDQIMATLFGLRSNQILAAGRKQRQRYKEAAA